MKPTLAVAVLAAALASAASAAPVPPSIVLDQPSPSFGDTVTFTITGKLGGHAKQVVYCYQDVNGDGLVDTEYSSTNPDLVFAPVDAPGTPVVLGGYVSIWTLRGGGAAECEAYLYAYGPGSTFRELAETEFEVLP